MLNRLEPRLGRRSISWCGLAFGVVALAALDGSGLGIAPRPAADQIPTASTGVGVASAPAAGADAARGGEHRRRVPSPFVPNLGQWEHSVRFVRRGRTMTVFLEECGWVLDLAPRAAHQRGRRVALRMAFEGAAPAPRLDGEQPLPGRHNYFLGNDPSRWRTHVPRYASVLYRGLYPGIDMRLRDARGHPEYDLLLSPHAELARVLVRVEGAERVRLAGDGALVFNTALGPVTQPVPATWQTAPHGERLAVACRYVVLAPDCFGFEVADWNRALPLTIDPGLQWSTFIGGSGIDGANGVFVDRDGVVTVAGRTNSLQFPTTPGAYSTTSLGSAAYISQFDPRRAGAQQLIYSTFLGGPERTSAYGVAVDGSGVATLFGKTNSRLLPTTSGAFSRTLGGSDDIFVSRLDPNKAGGAQLLYSTYLGGINHDQPNRFAVQANGVVTVTGTTQSGNFPTTPGAFAGAIAGSKDVFVSQLDPGRTAGAQLVYSTFLGGTLAQQAYGLSIEQGGVLAVAGWTSSPDFPTTPGAHDNTFNGGLADAFVCRLNPRHVGSAQLLYSTFLGGTARDWADGVFANPNGVLTVAGRTDSAGFPTTPGAFDRTPNGGDDVFVSRLDPAVAASVQLRYSTLIGGSGAEYGIDPVETSGVVTLVGYTDSPNFPTTPGAHDRTYNGNGDLFVSRLDPSRAGGAQAVYSTYLGGADLEPFPGAFVVGPAGAVTFPGVTFSADFPTTPAAWGGAYFGSRDGFVTQLDMLPSGVSAYGASSAGCGGPLAISVSSWPQVGNAAFSLNLQQRATEWVRAARAQRRAAVDPAAGARRRSLGRRGGRAVRLAGGGGQPGRRGGRAGTDPR